MRGLPFDINKGMRPSCFHCFRPLDHCMCRLHPAFEAHCNILILQHPNERRKYNSTSKLVTGALKNSKIIRGLIFDPQEIRSALAGQNAYLLFPSTDAQDCQSLPLDHNNTVIVLDGTWSEAGKVLHRNPILEQIPKLSFNVPLRSNFHIRKQPKENYLSTIESVAHLLKLSAVASCQQSKCSEYDRLFQMFDRMVDQQLNFFPRRRKLLTQENMP